MVGVIFHAKIARSPRAGAEILATMPPVERINEDIVLRVG